LRARYRRAPVIIREELMRTMGRIVKEGEFTSKHLAPKWRKHLARSITHSVTPMAGAVRGEWGTNAPYAKFMELGTRRHFVPAKHIGEWMEDHGFTGSGIVVSGRARPFIRPAFAKVRGKIRPEFSIAMKRMVVRLSGRG